MTRYNQKILQVKETNGWRMIQAIYFNTESIIESKIITDFVLVRHCLDTFD